MEWLKIMAIESDDGSHRDGLWPTASMSPRRRSSATDFRDAILAQANPRGSHLAGPILETSSSGDCSDGFAKPVLLSRRCA